VGDESWADVVRYFAFGSNMSSERFLARITEARSLGRGRLRGWRFACNKRGHDGSAKANIVRAEGAHVWGVVFSMPRGDLGRLDVIEGGYERIEVDVEHGGGWVTCMTYASTRRLDHTVPFDWYKEHIVRGAEEHELPEEYLAILRGLPHRSPED
jgi:hypothetical protein